MTRVLLRFGQGATYPGMCYGIPFPLSFPFQVAEQRFFMLCNRFNGVLNDFKDTDDRVEVITHRGFKGRIFDLMSDGLHLNLRGMRRYFNSMRRQAILQGNKSMG